jgi:hypothetical protein
MMTTFYNSKSFIFYSNDFENQIISESQARIFNYKIAQHATHSSGFYCPKYYEELINFLETNNINTAYFSLHPLCNLNEKFRKKILTTRKKIFWIDLEKKININNFAKSVQYKIKKNSQFKLKTISHEEFLKVYNKQTYYNSYLNLNLRFENIKIFKITNQLGSAYAALGFSRDIIEYLLACSDSNKSKDLQAVLIFELLKFFKSDAKAFNLGGGISAGDGVEKFKSFFAPEVKQQEVIKIILDRKRYENLINLYNNSNFFPSYANKRMLKKYFNYE